MVPVRVELSIHDLMGGVTFLHDPAKEVRGGGASAPGHKGAERREHENGASRDRYDPLLHLPPPRYHKTMRPIER
jgi:hypothetical protein